MKTHHCLLWILSSFAFNTIALGNSWENTGGPIGGLGYDIRMDKNSPNTMFVTDNFAGVLKSTNRGEKWIASNQGILGDFAALGNDVNIFSLTIDPNNSDTIWAGTRSQGAFGIFKSTDAGGTWQRKVTGISSLLDGFDNTNLIFRGFTVQPGNSNIVYAQAELSTNTQGKTFQKVHGRVFKSINGGESWSTIWTGNHLARYLIVDPSNSNTLYLSTGIFDVEAADANCDSNNSGDWGGEGVLKSTDAGANWAQINIGLLDLYVGSLKMHPSNPNILIAGTSGNDACQNFPPNSDMVGGLYITKNAGESWTRLLNTMISAVAFTPSNPSTLYGAFENGVWRSADGGETFTHLRKSNEQYGPSDLNAGIPIDLIVDNENADVLYANNYGGGVFKSQDSAKTWKNWSNGYSGAVIKQLATFPADDSFILASGLSGAFHSQHYGLNWQGLAFGSLGASSQTSGIAIHPTNNNIMLVADAFNGTLHRSEDGGQTFSQVLKHNSEFTIEFNRIQFAPNSDTVYATLARNNRSVFESLVIYKSIDAGKTFSQITHSMAHNNLRISDLHVVNVNTFYLATTDSDPGDDTHDGVIFKSTDGGANLWAIKLNSNTGAILQTREGKVIAGNYFSGIWQSADAQGIAINSTASWTQASSIPLTEPYCTDLIQHPDSEHVYLSTLEGVFSSSDYDTWAEFPSNFTGLDKHSGNALAITNNALYVGSDGGGVFRYDIRRSDTSPVASQFTAVNHVNKNTWVQSQAITLSGFANTGSQQINISNGLYSINGGAFTSSNTVVEDADTLKVMVLSSDSFSTRTTASVNIEHLVQDLVFAVTTQAQDSMPDAFSFEAINSVDLNTVHTSNAITIAGLNAASPISIENGSYQINQEDFTVESGQTNQDDSIRIKIAAASEFNTQAVATLNVGGQEQTFTVTTLLKDTTPDLIVFENIDNAPLDTVYTSNTVTISGINSEASISIDNGRYQINQNGYGAADNSVFNGDTVSIQLTSSSEYSAQTLAELTIGNTIVSFTVNTVEETDNPSSGGAGGTLFYLWLFFPLLLLRKIKNSIAAY